MKKEKTLSEKVIKGIGCNEGLVFVKDVKQFIKEILDEIDNSLSGVDFCNLIGRCWHMKPSNILNKKVYLEVKKKVKEVIKQKAGDLVE